MATHIQIGDISPRIQYTGDGVQTAFTYPFPIFVDADIEVYEDAVLKALATDYAVSGAGNSSGGTITFTAAPASGAMVTIRRNIAIQRTSDFQVAGEFRAEVINDELDYQTAALQQVETSIVRSLQLGPTDSGATTLPDKATRSSKYLGFDANGDPIATNAAGPIGPQGPGGNMDGANNLNELTSPPTARTNLGLGSAAVENVTAGGTGDLLRSDGDGSGLTGIVSGATVAEKANIMLNAFRIEVNGGLTKQNMVDGVADVFTDQTGVDTVGSLNETYDATNDLYNNPSQVAVSQSTGTVVGDMTSDGGLAAAFDGVISQVQTLSSNKRGGPGSGFVGKDWGAGVTKTLTGIEFYGSSDVGALYGGGATTFTWKLKGSNATPVLGGGTTLFSSGTVTNSAGIFVSQLTGIIITTAYRYHWLEIAQPSENPICAELTFYEDITVLNMTLLSNATAALSVPTSAFIVVEEEDVETTTNLMAFPEDLGNAAWTKTNVTVAANVTTDPAGGTGADSLTVDSTASAVHETSKSVNWTGLGTLSIHAKANTTSKITIAVWDGANAIRGYFDLSTGTVNTGISDSSAVIIDAGSGWYRCSLSSTNAGSGAFTVGITDSSWARTWNGDGTSSVYLWGGMAEDQSGMSPYTATTGTAISLNSDLKVYASRDGGTTWTVGTLAVGTNLTTGRILTTKIDVSAQPVGTSMKYKIETLNTKQLKIHSVALQWS